MIKVNNDENNHIETKSKYPWKKRDKCMKIGVSMFTRIGQILIFSILLCISLVLVVAGLCMPILFIIYIVVILWIFVMYKCWKWLSKFFGGCRKLYDDHISTKAESRTKL